MIQRTSAAASLVAAGCVLLVGCGEEPRPDLIDPGADNRTATGTAVTLPKSYSFVLTSSCGERGLIGRYRVTVRDEQVSGVKSMNDDYPYEPTLAEVPTLQDIVRLAGSARPASVVEYVVDDQGVPRSLSLDPLPDAIDDEECYEVDDVVVLSS